MSYTPPPAPPPLGQAPGPKPLSGAQKALIGCGVLFTLGSIVLAVSIFYFMPRFMHQAAGMVSDSQKKVMAKQLSDDHTEDQRQRFFNAVDLITQAMFTPTVTSEPARLILLQTLNLELADMQRDRIITVEESQSWAEKVERAFGPETDENDEGEQP